MINFFIKSGAITLMGFCFLGISAIANPDTENPADILKPIENEVREDIDEDKPVIPVKSRKPKTLQLGDIVEVHPRTEMWETIHSGDLNRGTVQFKFVTE